MGDLRGFDVKIFQETRIALLITNVMGYFSPRDWRRGFDHWIANGVIEDIKAAFHNGKSGR